MEPTYSTDSELDNVVFVAEDGSAFSRDELDDLLIKKVNPKTGLELSEKDITVLHQILLEDEPEDVITYVDYTPWFKYPYLAMYSLMAIQLGYIMWSVI